MHRCQLSESLIPRKESASMAIVIEAPHLANEDLILFVHNNKEVDGTHVKPEGLGLPGGTLKPDETPLGCAIRECRQETGIDPELVAQALGVEIEWISYQHSLLDLSRDPKYASCKKVAEMVEDREIFLGKGDIDPKLQTQTFSDLYSIRVTDWEVLPEKFRQVFEMRKAYKPEEELVIDVSPDLAWVLGIVEAKEREGQGQEITKIALFRKSHVLGWYEEWKAYSAAMKAKKSISWPRKGEFYASHILRLSNVFARHR